MPPRLLVALNLSGEAKNLMHAELAAPDFRCLSVDSLDDPAWRTERVAADLVIVDLGAEEGDVPALLRAIEQREAGAELLVLLSPERLAQHKPACLAAGVDRLLVLPLTPGELGNAARHALVKRDLLDTLKGAGQSGSSTRGRFRPLVDDASVAILVLRDGTFKHLNVRALALLGLPLATALAHPARQLLPPPAAKELQRAQEQVLDGGQNLCPLSLLLPDQDRALQTFEGVALRTRFERTPALLVLLWRPVFDLGASPGPMSSWTVLEQAPVLVCQLDQLGAVRYVNATFEEWTGVSRGEALGLPWQDLDLLDAAATTALQQRMLDRLDGAAPRSISVTLQGRRAQGRAVQCEVSFVDSSDGHRLGVTIWAWERRPLPRAA